MTPEEHYDLAEEYSYEARMLLQSNTGESGQYLPPESFDRVLMHIRALTSLAHAFRGLLHPVVRSRGGIRRPQRYDGRNEAGGPRF